MGCRRRLVSAGASGLILCIFGILLTCATMVPPLKAADDQPAANSVTKLIFEAELMKDIETPLTLHYKFRMSGRDVQPAFNSQAIMTVEKGEDEDAKNVSFDMFEGEHRRRFGPISATMQNPIILVFLQRDVLNMAKLSGGSSGYFQKALRHDFNKASTSEDISIDFDGSRVKGRKVTLQPFKDDPNINRFPEFSAKSYEFWISPDIPGGLYKISASTPTAGGDDVILEESFILDHVSQGGAQ